MEAFLLQIKIHWKRFEYSNRKLSIWKAILL